MTIIGVEPVSSAHIQGPLWCQVIESFFFGSQATAAPLIDRSVCEGHSRVTIPGIELGRAYCSTLPRFFNIAFDLIEFYSPKAIPPAVLSSLPRSKRENETDVDV